MPNPTAKYILTAEDQTKAAMDSARRGFENLDKTAKVAGKGIQTMTQLFLGAGLISGIRRFTDSVVDAAAANDKDFAASLAKVDEATKKLLVPSSGLPAVQQTMDKLNATLRDPALVAAADALTSKVLHAWANLKLFAAEAVAGWSLIMNGGPNQSDKINDEILALRAKREAMASGSGGGLEQHTDSAFRDKKALAEIDAKLIDLGKQYWAALDAENKAAQQAAAAERAHAAEIQAGNDARAAAILTSYRLKRAMAEVDEAGKYLDSLTKSEQDSARAAYEMAEGLKKVDAALSDDLADSMAAFDKGLEHGLGDSLDGVTEKLIQSTSDMSVYADQAARNMQSAFADFLFDPFENGLGGMVQGFADSLRRMAAEAAASKVFEWLFGSNGSAGAAGSFLSGLFGGARADGGPVSAGRTYLVGERGPELFTPGVSGGITPNGSGAPSITYNIDARGATTDLIAALPKILKENNEALKADLLNGIQRRKYAI